MNHYKLLFREPSDDLGWYIANPETEEELCHEIRKTIGVRLHGPIVGPIRTLTPEDYILHLHRKPDSPIFLTKGAFGELKGTYKEIQRYCDYFVLTERLTCPKCGKSPDKQLFMMARLMQTDFGKK